MSTHEQSSYIATPPFAVKFNRIASYQHLTEVDGSTKWRAIAIVSGESLSRRIHLGTHCGVLAKIVPSSLVPHILVVHIDESHFQGLEPGDR